MKAIFSIILGIVSLALVNFSFISIISGSIGLALAIISVTEIKKQPQSGIFLAFLGGLINVVGVLLPVIFYIKDYISMMYDIF